MDSNVLISIKTIQKADGEELEPIELQTPGKFGVINNKYYIIYDESELTGFADTTTTIKIWEGNAVVTRRGRYNMKLAYQTGKRNLCLYPTPYGEIAASIYTSEIDFYFSDQGGRLRVDYTLDADNENFIQNSLNVSVCFLCRQEQSKRRKDGLNGYTGEDEG